MVTPYLTYFLVQVSHHQGQIGPKRGWRFLVIHLLCWNEPTLESFVITIIVRFSNRVVMAKHDSERDNTYDHLESPPG